MSNKKENKAPKMYKAKTVWYHLLIAVVIFVMFFVGLVAGWNIKSANQSNVNSQAQALVTQLKSSK